MKVCPECGYSENPMWRARANRAFCSYVKAETLEYLNPELFNKIKKAMADGEPYYHDGHDVYHITKTGLNVEKIEKEYYDFMKWGAEPQEKHYQYNVSPFIQTKLNEVQK